MAMCTCGRGPVAEGNGMPDACAWCLREHVAANDPNGCLAVFGAHRKSECPDCGHVHADLTVCEVMEGNPEVFTA